MATPLKTYNLANFHLSKILYNNSKNKSICVLGNFINFINRSSLASDEATDGNEVHIGNDANNGAGCNGQAQQQHAIIILEKLAFTERDVGTDDVVIDESADNEAGGSDDDGVCVNKRILFTSDTKLTQLFVNDIYGNFECYPNADLNKLKATIICPVTDKHIAKYSIQTIHIVQETPVIYKTITEPRLEIQAAQFSIDWVYNILEHKQEADRIVFEDPCKENGFVLLPDLKWDGKTIETLYLIAIVHRHNLKSIRSLSGEHLPLLRNIRDKGIDAITKRYDIPRSQLRIYFHYQPSFYHLHVHFTYLKYDAPGIFCEKSHLLDSVICNLELLPDYYEKATLSFVIRENDAAFQQYADVLGVSSTKAIEAENIEDTPAKASDDEN